jgi:hypothetical protein
VRLRQGVLVAEDLEATLADLHEAFGIEPAFRDPGVKVFGLVNAVLPVGDTFLEVVSPTTPDAPAARYRERHGGDGGYMVMVQSDDLAADRARMEALGVRIAWAGELDDIAGIHLHPKDTGGALLSLDQPTPPESWRWAGPDWRAHVHTEVVERLAAVEIASPHPERLSARWGEVLGRPVVDEAIELDAGCIRFVPGSGERLAAFELEASDRARAGESRILAGATFRLV